VKPGWSSNLRELSVTMQDVRLGSKYARFWEYQLFFLEESGYVN
jgi:hypothetical protein